jgi:hypothetical protein
MMKNVAINIDSITQVKIAIAGKTTTLGKFYAEAAAEKIERDRYRYLTWQERHAMGFPPKSEGE